VEPRITQATRKTLVEEIEVAVVPAARSFDGGRPAV